MIAWSRTFGLLQKVCQSRSQTQLLNNISYAATTKWPPPCSGKANSKCSHELSRNGQIGQIGMNQLGQHRTLEQGNPSLVEDGLRIHLPCRKFHSPHLRATFSEPGKSLSTTFFGLVFGNFGSAIGF